MDGSLLIKGILIGFSIAAPVGPIGVLCIRRTLADGRASGLLSGLGAATADALYGAVAALGLTFISSTLLGQQFWLRLLGGAFLLFLGVRTLITPPATEGASASGRGLLGAYASTFFLTLTNPTTILSFVAIFAGLGAGSAAGDYASAALMVLGVFLGSALWWLILSGGVGAFRSRFNLRAMRWVNVLSGVIITTFGLLALASLAL
jgi:threonine/homoserine/homoserine lactone efflux protein